MAGTSPGDFLKILECLSTPKKPKTGQARPISLDFILEHNTEEALKLLKEDKYVACYELMNKKIGADSAVIPSAGTAVNATSTKAENTCDKELDALLNELCKDDTRWRYVLLCLATLTLLGESQNVAVERYNVLMQDMQNARPAETAAPPMSPDTLSLEQKKIVMTSLQFVVCLGVLPALQPGVGIPLQRRTEFSRLLQNTENEKEISALEKEWRLLYCLKSLLGLFDQPSLATLILSRNFGDILAGLLQICCASSLRQSKESQNQPKKLVKKVTSERNLVAEDVAYCESQVKRLLEKIYPPLIVRELLVLQGGPGQTISKDGKPTLEKSPVWLRRVCGRFLSDILMKPKGVQYVLKGLLHSQEGSASGTAAEWQRCDAVSRVIAHCPRQSVSIHDYYKAIGPQVLELLRCEDRKQARIYTRVAVRTLLAMMQQQIALTVKYVIQPLLQPLISCTAALTDKNSVTGVHILVHENQLEGCIDDVHKVYTTSGESQGLLVSSLHRCAHVLFKLHCFTNSSVVHYRSKVKEVILVYLAQAEVITALECVKAFVFEQLLDKMSPMNSGPRTPLMCLDVCFMAGPSGGVIAVRTANSNDTNSQWETRCNTTVDLLHALQRDELSADFFIYLLQQLTKILAKEINPEEDNIQAAISQRLEVINAEEILRRNLILLSLLASMCEKLGHTCFKSTSHILQFVKATLERGVKVLEHTNDEELGIFESETVTMAMGLLTAVMGGASEITSEDREQTKELLPLLEKLSLGHPDESVKEMATDLRIAIATHGFVLSHVLNQAKSHLHRNRDVTQSRVEQAINKSKNKAGAKKNLKNVNESKSTKLEQRKTAELDVKPKNKGHQSHSSANNDSPNEAYPLLDAPVTKKSVIDLLAEGLEDMKTTQQLSADDEEELKQILAMDNAKPKITKKSPLIEVLSSSDANEDESEPDNREQNGENCTESKVPAAVSNAAYRKNYAPASMKPTSTSGLDQAFRELLDPLIPVRGHALISLRRLIEQKDPETLEKTDVLLNIFQENLEHNDTYIYLSAIQGLAALANHLPQKVVVVLAHEYANFKVEDKKDRIPELRLKLGEVLTKSIRMLGETLPNYGDLLLRCTLQGTKDPDHYVRASCLSNLAELCKFLRFSLGKVVFELFECISALLKTDPEKEVRQAAAMFITLLLQGLGSDTFKVLDTVMRDLYRLLKITLKVEKDDTVKMHCLLALQELDKIMEAFLFPKQTLSKRITVRESPNVDFGFN